jgi:hypothetical protein
MEALQDELAAESCYAQSYTHMYELSQEVEAAAARVHKPVPEVTMRFSSDAVREPRRYNPPWRKWLPCSSEQMAALRVAKIL